MENLFPDSEEAVTIETVRNDLNAVINEAFQQNQTTLIEALPAMGKSYGVVEWAYSSNKPLTIFTSRRELYGQYEEWCEEFDLSYLSLPAFHHSCASIGERYEIESKISSLYEAGLSGAELHRNSERYFGEKLPCQQDDCCPYMEKREFNPEEYSVLIGHYLQAHNKDYIEDRYIAFDEFPDDAYFFEPTHNEATRAITNFLEQEDDLPFDNWKELNHQRYHPDYQDALSEWKDDFGYYSHRDTTGQLQQKPGFHAYAPLLTHAGLEFELLDNEWEYASMGGGTVAVKSPEDEWTVLIPPNLYPAESVIALDGTPTVTKWRIVLGGDYIEYEKVLDSEKEKREYLSEALDIEIIQSKAGTKPYQSGKHVNLEKDATLLEGITRTEGKPPSVISSKKAIELYEDEGVDEFIERAEHYGNLKGSNEFSTTRLGAVIGSPHPPEDEAVERWGALDGEAVERKRDGKQVQRGNDLDFGPKGNALFRDVVENEVLQAVLRFGREEVDGERGATVYVHTSRLPRWVRPDARVSISPWSDGMHDVVNALKNSEKWPDGEWKNKEIAEQTSIGKPQVRELMKELADEGYVSYWQGGLGNAYHWSNERLEEIGAYGQVTHTV